MIEVVTSLKIEKPEEGRVRRTLCVPHAGAHVVIHEDGTIGYSNKKKLATTSALLVIATVGEEERVRVYSLAQPVDIRLGGRYEALIAPAEGKDNFAITVTDHATHVDAHRDDDPGYHLILRLDTGELGVKVTI
jgi:hypothetical protein